MGKASKLLILFELATCCLYETAKHLNEDLLTIPLISMECGHKT